MEENLTDNQLLEYQQKEQMTLEFMLELKSRIQTTKNNIKMLLED